MAVIQPFSRTVYYSPTARRSYLTKDAAARAEARALIRKKYPTEHEERDSIGITNRGWHWTEDERLVRVYDRLWRKTYRRLLREEKGL